MEQDLIVMVKDEKSFKDGPIETDLTASVILLSYNRPRMLREAIDSVVSQSYPKLDLYVCDDGSDFDVWETISSYEDERILLYQAPRIKTDQRIKHSRIAENIGNILKEIDDQGVVFYLCDDDLMAPEWISRSMRGYATYPDNHVVAGESWYFNEGESLADAKYGMDMYESSGIPTAYWSTGSFSHRMICYREEGLRWKDNIHGHSQDTNFIMDLWKLHSDYIYIPVPALYRREHDNTLSAKLGRKGPDGKYTPGYIPPPATEEMITGWME